MKNATKPTRSGDMRNFWRWAVVRMALFVMCMCVAQSALAVFSVGQRVRAANVHNSRSLVTAGSNAIFSLSVCEIAAGQLGTVQQGPQTGYISGSPATTYQWYKISWDSGICLSFGWSAEFNGNIVPVTAASINASALDPNCQVSSLAGGYEMRLFNASYTPPPVTQFGQTTTFSGLTVGANYNIEVSHTNPNLGVLELWGAEQVASNTSAQICRRFPYTVGSGLSNLTLGQSQLLGVSVAAGSNMSFVITVNNRRAISLPVRVRLDIQRDGVPISTPLSSAQSISPSGTASFTIPVTTSAAVGVYTTTVLVEANTSASNWFVTDTFSRTILFSVNPPNGALNYSISGGLSTSRAVLFANACTGTSLQTLTGASGTFTSLANGNYCIETYNPNNSYLPSAVSEFWGSKSATVSSGSGSVTLTRVEPYASSFAFLNNAGQQINTVVAGSSVRLRATIVNPGPNQRGVQVLFDTRNTSNPSQLFPCASSVVNISGGATANVECTFTPTAGTWQRQFKTTSNVTAAFPVTDSYTFSSVASEVLTVTPNPTGTLSYSITGGFPGSRAVLFANTCTGTSLQTLTGASGTFTALANGNYCVETYNPNNSYLPSAVSEFWGSKSATVSSGSGSVTLTRVEPYASSFAFLNNAGQQINTVVAGSSVRLRATIVNPGPNQRGVQVLFDTRNTTNPSQLFPCASNIVNVLGGGSSVTIECTFTPTAGTWQRQFRTLSNVTTPSITADSYQFSTLPAESLVVTPPPSGVLNFTIPTGDANSSATLFTGSVCTGASIERTGASGSFTGLTDGSYCLESYHRNPEYYPSGTTEFWGSKAASVAGGAGSVTLSRTEPVASNFVFINETTGQPISGAVTVGTPVRLRASVQNASGGQRGVRVLFRLREAAAPIVLRSCDSPLVNIPNLTTAVIECLLSSNLTAGTWQRQFEVTSNVSPAQPTTDSRPFSATDTLTVSASTGLSMTLAAIRVNGITTQLPLSVSRGQLVEMDLELRDQNQTLVNGATVGMERLTGGWLQNTPVISTQTLGGGQYRAQFFVPTSTNVTSQTVRVLATTTIASGFFDLPMQLRAPTPGVTVVIHGFKLDGCTGPSTMNQDISKISLNQVARAIQARNGGAIWVWDAAYNAFSIKQGSATSGEITILVDWGCTSNNDSAGFGEATAHALYAAMKGFKPNAESFGMANEGLVSQLVAVKRLHVIAHSFGSGVAFQLLRRLRHFDGVTNVHLTLLDPHDFTEWTQPIDGSTKIPHVQISRLNLPQISFDNYYQRFTQLPTPAPTGRCVSGAKNTFLSIFRSLPANSLDPGSNHSGVWYRYLHTILPDQSIIFGNARNPDWFEGSEAWQTGFAYDESVGFAMPSPNSCSGEAYQTPEPEDFEVMNAVGSNFWGATQNYQFASDAFFDSELFSALGDLRFRPGYSFGSGSQYQIYQLDGLNAAILADSNSIARIGFINRAKTDPLFVNSTFIPQTAVSLLLDVTVPTVLPEGMYSLGTPLVGTLDIAIGNPGVLSQTAYQSIGAWAISTLPLDNSTTLCAQIPASFRNASALFRVSASGNKAAFVRRFRTSSTPCNPSLTVASFRAGQRSSGLSIGNLPASASGSVVLVTNATNPAFAVFLPSSSVVLTAPAADPTGASFGQWRFCDSNPSPRQCTVLMNQHRGVEVEYTATTPIPGACGTANGQIYSQSPSTGLCGTGTASTVSGAGPWQWSCSGLNGGATASCSAQVSDTTPNGFSFVSQTGVTVNSTLRSNIVTITGINALAPVSVAGGSYSIGCNGLATNTMGAISNGQTVCVEHTSSSNPSASTTSTLTIAGISANFTSTTASATSNPSLRIESNSVQEGNSGSTQVSFALVLSEASSLPVSFTASTSDAGALAGSDYLANSQSLTIPAGSTTGVFNVQVNGDTNFESNETFNVTVSGVSGATLAAGQGVGTIVNDDIQLPMLSIDDVALLEGNSGTTMATFQATLSQPALMPVSFSAATANGSAQAGSDYVANTQSALTIPAGQTQLSFAVMINGDLAVESDENFFVNLTNVAGATLGDAQGSGTIINDDMTTPLLSINDATVTEGNSDSSLASFTVSLSQAAASPVTFDISTADGTATAGSDFIARNESSVTIAAGSTTAIFAVTINGDITIEPSESFSVILTNVTGAALAGAQGLGTILNDDSAPVALSITDVSVAEGNSGTSSASFNVTLSQAATSTVTFDIATSDATASAGTDYVASSQSGVSIVAGSTSANFVVAINGDTVVESNETFAVNLANPLGATIADGTGVGTIANDDVSSDVIMSDGFEFQQTYSIGGNISGLPVSSTIGLVLSRGTPLSAVATINIPNGNFQFDYVLPTNTRFTVTAEAIPSGYDCMVNNGSGQIASAAITNVSVTCALTPAYTVGGTITGNGSTPVSLSLVVNSQPRPDVSFAGPGFSFADQLGTNIPWRVEVASQPVGLNCLATNNTGTVTNANVTNVQVNCSAAQAATTTVITSDDPDPSLIGQDYIVAVSVTSASATPTGTVQVSDGAANCQVTLSTGVGTCLLSSSGAPGARTLTATYAANTNFLASSGTSAHLVNAATNAFGCNGPVYAIASAPGTNDVELYVGGQFSACGGVPANNIARLSGSAWLSMGAGFGGSADQVNAIAVNGADVVIGGIITGGTSRVARWNGTSWQQLGALGVGTVNVLSWYYQHTVNPRLLVGGSPPIGLQYWDGSSWQPFNGGVQGEVSDLDVLGNDLIVAGTFSTVGGAVGASNLARWNGTAWTSMGGFNSAVDAIEVVGDKLYAAGTFSSVGALTAQRFAYWVNGAWFAAGNGIDLLPVAMSVYGSEVFVGGSFGSAGGLSVNRLVRWNDVTQQWSEVGSGANNGANGTIFSLLVDREKLWAGGVFSSAFGDTATRLASFPLTGQCASVPANIRSWFRGENSLDSVAGVTGQLVNGASIVGEGKVGSAFRFDGIDDSFDVSTPQALPPLSGDRAIEFWLRPDVSIGQGEVLSHFLANRASHSIGTANGGAYFETIGVTPRASSSTTGFQAGVWYHLSVVSGATVTKLYVNGRFVGACTGCGPALFSQAGSPVDKMRFGWDGIVRTESGFGFKGLIDEIGIYDRAINTNEINSIYRAGAAGKCTVSAPTLSFSSPVDSTIVFSNGNRSLTVTPLGGSGTGAAATTTFGTCSYSMNASIPSPFVATSASLSLLSGSSMQSFALACTPQTAGLGGNLFCLETRGANAPIVHRWVAYCPKTGPEGTPWRPLNGPGTNNTSGVWSDQAGTIYAARRAGGIFKYFELPAEWQRVDAPIAIAGETTVLRFGPSGKAAAYSGSGLYIRESETAAFQKCTTGPCATAFLNMATDMSWDLDGNLAFGQGSNVWIRRADLQWANKNYAALGTGFETQIFSVLYNDAGDLFVGSRSLHRLKSGNTDWETLYQTSPRAIMDIQLTGKGEVVFAMGGYVGIGGANTTMFTVTGDTVQQVGVGSQVSVTEFVLLPNGTMFGTAGAVYQRQLFSTSDWVLTNENLPSNAGTAKLDAQLRANVLVSGQYPNSLVDGFDVHIRSEVSIPSPSFTFFPAVGSTVGFPNTAVGNQSEQLVSTSPGSLGVPNSLSFLRCGIIGNSATQFSLFELANIVVNGATATARIRFNPTSAGQKSAQLRCVVIAPGRPDAVHVWNIQGTGI